MNNEKQIAKREREAELKRLRIRCDFIEERIRELSSEEQTIRKRVTILLNQKAIDEMDISGPR